MSPKFIGDPTGHLKSFAKSNKCVNEPFTLNFPGILLPFRSSRFNESGVYFEHHDCAAFVQKICLGSLNSMPGSLSSTVSPKYENVT